MKVLIILASLFITLPVNAKDKWDFAWSHKSKCSEGGMRQMNLCLSSSYRDVDKELNRVYGVLKEKNYDSTRLVEAQRAWIKFRDLECKAISPAHNGSLYPYELYSCLIDITEKRINDLERYLGWCNESEC